MSPLPPGPPPGLPAPRPPDGAEPWPAGRPVAFGLGLVLLLLGGLVGWGATARIAGAVIAPGQVEVQESRQVVQHPDGGVVEAILVREGDAVAPGQPLLRLDGTLLASEHAIVEMQFFEVLARRGRLLAERDGAAHIVFPTQLAVAAAGQPEVAALMQGQADLFAARAETHAQRLAQLARRQDQLAAQLAGLEAQGRALRLQAALTDEELAAQQALLDQGLTQAARVLALRREAARIEGMLGAVAAEIAQAEAGRAGIALEMLMLGAERREAAEAELRDLGVRALELAERRRSLAERIARLELRAPVAGVVMGLQLTTPRAVLRPAEPLLFLVPQDRPLLVAARIAPADIDQVSVGQEAVLVFPAFGLRDLPEIRGRVALVSADAFVDDRLREAHYRAEIALDAAALAALGERVLLPGMPAEAHIRTTERSPIAYLLQPLSGYFARAFREG